MLEFSKTILAKFSFNEELFAKEFQKSISELNDYEIELLCKWCQEEYGDKFSDLIESVSKKEII